MLDVMKHLLASRPFVIAHDGKLFNKKAPHLRGFQYFACHADRSEISVSD
jgi:hypothetical protein